MNNRYLMHHGVLGQKWGVRRFQNLDGSLTSAGKRRYAKDIAKAYRQNDLRTVKSTVASGVVFGPISAERKNRLLDYKRKKDDAMNRMLIAEEDFDNSGKADEIYKKSRNETINWYKTNDPDEFERMTKMIKSKEAYDYQDFHDFRKMYEGISNTNYTEALNSTDYDTLATKWREARDEYEQAAKEIADDLLGHYGHIRATNLATLMTRSTSDIVISEIGSILSDLEKKKL